MTTPWRPADTVLALAALAVLLVTSGYLAHQVLYAPDEESHLVVVDHHAHELTPLTWDEFAAGPERGHPYHLYSPLPYLPYLPAAIAADHAGSSVSPLPPGVFVTRLGGLVIATAQFALTVALVRRMAGRASWRQCVAVAFVVNLLPQLRFLHAYVNADAVSILVATLCAYVALGVLRRPRVRTVDAVSVAVVAGLAAHMRYHILPMALLPLGVLVWRVARDHGSVRRRLRILGLAAALSLAIALPVPLAVATELANGHLSASGDHEALRSDTFDGRQPAPFPMADLLRFRVETAGSPWTEAWSFIPGIATLRTSPLRWATALAAVGTLGMILPARRVFDRRGRAVALASLGAFAAALAAMAVQYPFTIAGRFLLPAGITVLCGAVLGTAELVGRVPRVRHAVRSSVLMWFCVTGGMLAWTLAEVARA